MHSPRIHRHGEGNSSHDGDNVVIYGMFCGEFISDLVFLVIGDASGHGNCTGDEIFSDL